MLPGTQIPIFAKARLQSAQLARLSVPKIHSLATSKFGAHTSCLSMLPGTDPNFRESQTPKCAAGATFGAENTQPDHFKVRSPHFVPFDAARHRSQFSRKPDSKVLSWRDFRCRKYTAWPLQSSEPTLRAFRCCQAQIPIFAKARLQSAQLARLSGPKIHSLAISKFGAHTSCLSMLPGTDPNFRESQTPKCSAGATFGAENTQPGHFKVRSPHFVLFDAARHRPQFSRKPDSKVLSWRDFRGRKYTAWPLQSSEPTLRAFRCCQAQIPIFAKARLQSVQLARLSGPKIHSLATSKFGAHTSCLSMLPGTDPNFRESQIPKCSAGATFGAENTQPGHFKVR